MSFDKALFKKELKKLIFHLTPDEVVKLKAWLKENYSKEFFENDLSLSA